MIKNQERIISSIGYVLLWRPEHHRAQKSGAYKGYVYEHFIVAEKNIGRSLRKKEEVHHLDFDRINNSPSNLLVLNDTEHARLHGWLQVIKFQPKVRVYGYTVNAKTIGKILSKYPRCKNCFFPMSRNKSMCSMECVATQNKIFIRGTERKKPSKKKLKMLLWKYPKTKIGKRYGVSDRTVGIWQSKMNIKGPPRGYFLRS